MSRSARHGLLAIEPSLEAGRLHRFRHQAMDCGWELYIQGQETKYARQAARAAFAEIDRVEQELSRFVPTSDIARINALPPGQALRVGVDAFQCLELAVRLHAETQGAFDVTIGALIDGEQADIAETEAPVGMDLLEIRRATRSVAIHRAGLRVDLGGIGKGYAIDQLVALLHDWSVGGALIHAGQSTLYALGNLEPEAGWVVDIRDPIDHAASLGRVCLRDGALSGSGALLHGRHIVDPRTRQPAAQALGAWAAAPSAALADALSTAFMVLSPEQVEAYCRRHPHVSGLLYVATRTGPVLRRYGRELESRD